MKTYKNYSANDADLFYTFEGSLMRKRDDRCVRLNYAYQRNQLETAREVAACIRSGEYVWPGGYRLYFFTTDGACLSFDAVIENWYQVVYSMRHEIDDGWRIAGVGCAAYDDEPAICDHSGVELT